MESMWSMEKGLNPLRVVLGLLMCVVGEGGQYCRVAGFRQEWAYPSLSIPTHRVGLSRDLPRGTIKHAVSGFPHSGVAYASKSETFRFQLLANRVRDSNWAGVSL